MLRHSRTPSGYEYLIFPGSSWPSDLRLGLRPLQLALRALRLGLGTLRLAFIPLWLRLTPTAGPQTPLAAPKTLWAGHQTPLTGRQTITAGHQSPPAGPHTRRIRAEFSLAIVVVRVVTMVTKLIMMKSVYANAVVIKANGEEKNDTSG